MTDLVKRLRDWEHVHPEDQDKTEGHLYEEAADRIEELQSRLRWVITERDDTFVRMLRRVETAEAEDKLLRDSRAEDYSELLATLDEILQEEHDVEISASAAAIRTLLAERDSLKAVLKKAVGLLEAWINVAAHCTIEEGVCCCGDNMDTHAKPINCGHSPVDRGVYIAEGLVEETNTTLAELTGGKDE